MDGNIKYCFKTQIVDECNLNCRGCDHFAPIAKKWHQPLNDFINMMKMLRKTVWKNIKEIELYGGEPLLHENFYEMLMAMKVLFGNSIILSVETNGILLENFFRKYKNLQTDKTIEYQVTEYVPTKGIVKELQSKFPNLVIFETKHTPMELDTNKFVHKDTMFNVNLRKEKNDINVLNRYKHCYCKSYESHSMCLRNWYLSPCPLFMCIDIFDDIFDEKYRNKEDYVEINETLTSDDLYKIAHMPCENCKRCGQIKYGFEYEISKKNRSEWQL